jgi:ribosomal protein S18 acetylase RimI-like enzyme
MRFRKITTEDAAFLDEIFSVPEYALYFAENDTTQEEWRERIAAYYLSARSYIVSDGEEKVGWIMYSIEEDTCSIDIIVLHPQKRYLGYGKAIFSDLIAANPDIRRIKLDVQKRNKTALSFYRTLGFVVEGEEMQPVGESEEPYCNLSLTL